MIVMIFMATMMPVMMIITWPWNFDFRKGRVVAVLGASGGTKITTAVAQVVAIIIVVVVMNIHEGHHKGHHSQGHCHTGYNDDHKHH